MPFRFQGFFLVVILFTLPVMAENGKTFECDAAKERSKVGVYERDEVSITADRDQQQCLFSVNGASVGSPPPDKIIGGLRFIAKREMSSLLESGDVAPLAYALLSAAPVTEIPDELIDILKNGMTDLAKCFKAFESEETEFETTTDSIVCRTVKRIGSAPVLDGGMVRVTTSNPELMLVVHIDSIEYYLFVSFSLPEDWFG